MRLEPEHRDSLAEDISGAATGPELAQALADELDAIDSLSKDRAERIGELRRRMDAACDVGELTIREWRALIEKVAAARAEAPSTRSPHR